ncbi:hypothetical protein B0I37DRAFT_375358 [Chaetomium sp. MPI-CAGE-AT-0009]|nr:hypothetical protein B0I37DRAFT_375358 [Chaetomium sp. MPI-CAGE-AT-0009]
MEWLTSLGRDVSITATRSTATFIAHLGFFLNSPVAELVSRSRLSFAGGLVVN